MRWAVEVDDWHGEATRREEEGGARCLGQKVRWVMVLSSPLNTQVTTGRRMSDPFYETSFHPAKRCCPTFQNAEVQVAPIQVKDTF